MNTRDSSRLAYTVAEAVKVSGIGRTSLYAMIRDGRLDARKAGSKTLIPAASLREMLAGLPRLQAGRDR